jgi:prenyltransferase beta subunit
VNRLRFAAVCLLVTPALWAQAPPDKAAVAYVEGLRARDGGYLPAAGQKESTLRATSAALRALKYFGGPVREKDATAQFVKSCHDKATGGFADRPGGKPDVFTTAVGVMAVKELQLPAEPYADGVVKFLSDNATSFEEIRIAAAGLEALGRSAPEPVLAKWVAECGKLANKDDTVGTGDGVARDTARVLVTLMRLGGKPDSAEVIARHLRTLSAGQRADGGFGKGGAKGSDLESCYQVMRAYHMLKGKPDAEKLRKFIASCRNKDGGYGVSPGQPSSVAATYYASIILHWLAEK